MSDFDNLVIYLENYTLFTKLQKMARVLLKYRCPLVISVSTKCDYITPLLSVILGLTQSKYM